MYIVFANKCDGGDGEYSPCGYLQIDNEKPMKIHKIRIFKVNNGYRTIKYMSEFPVKSTTFVQTFSESFSTNDVLWITVYMRANGLEQDPVLDRDSASDDVINTLDQTYLQSRQLIEENYEEALQFVKNYRYQSQHTFPDSFWKGWETNAMNFLKTVDLRCCIAMDEFREWIASGSKKVTNTSSSSGTSSSSSSGGCYVATCVYGSYDCPEVWTLRRFRDDTLASTWYGRLFIRLYYAVSPTVVKLFGNTKWFSRVWRGKLDKLVNSLQSKGVESTPYNDKKWK